MKYTEEIHAQRLIKILEKPNTCSKCPASKHYNPEPYIDLEFKYDNNCCEVCLKFISRKREHYWMCPCDLGVELANKLSWLALEEKGYI